ncbi:hypothetical protein OIU79_023977 [Salix purpurea]|uniref:Uncharacterized protein n=1 Tax=Salix purpurea TaxID=77065 RepID=A0A9Q0W9U9_SALPP|nr:hypothetical protein OIU79_023977 [Salix purpurea]
MTTWADRVKVTDSSTRFTLDPIPCLQEGSKPVLTTDMLTDNAEQWDRCMVGFFPGFRMNYHTVNMIANRIWKVGGLESVMSTASGRDYAENEESRSVHNECAPVEKNKSTHIERVAEEKNQQRVGIPQDGHSMTNGKSNLTGNHTLKVIIKGKNETRPVGQVEETITEPRYPNEKGAYPSKDKNLTAQEEPSMTEEQDRVLKGKMKEVESNVCTVNDSSSLQSHDTLDEEESKGNYNHKWRQC